jgi:hypothetical protein
MPVKICGLAQMKLQTLNCWLRNITVFQRLANAVTNKDSVCDLRFLSALFTKN